MNQPSSPVQAVIELFQGPLAEVRFADVDAAGLSNLAVTVDAAAVAVAEQEAHLVELRQALAERQEALMVLAQRALAYARVYAEHDESLTEQLARITLPRASKPRKASTKTLGTEPAAASTDSASTDSASTDSASTDSASTDSADEELADPPANATDAADVQPVDAPSAPARKGKRRPNTARDESSDGA